MHSSSIPAGPLTADGAPNLPADFAATFTSRYVDTGRVRLHAVIGGDGPPLLLVHGWPETWYAWRLLMPALARDFEVIAVDQRGMGLSDKPEDGYDTRTQAGDLAALMSELGHGRFAVAGHDTGFAIAYALAADHHERVERLVLAEIPGSPGTVTAPPLFLPDPLNDRLWHLGFNRIEGLNELLVAGREDAFYRWEFDAAAKPLPEAVIDYYVGLLSNPDALRGSFGEHVGEAVAAVADDVQSVVIADAGHFVAEESPEDVLAAMTRFLASYRDHDHTAHNGPRAVAA